MRPMQPHTTSMCLRRCRDQYNTRTIYLVKTEFKKQIKFY